MQEIIVDNFAGGGGASTGIEMATGKSVDIAINHDIEAIKMHKINHPNTEHYCESVWDVDPVRACRGRSVALAWFSPDCKHFSKAKGKKPVDKNIRGLAWVAVKWAKAVKPRVIMLENVEEFKTWGPLLETDKGTVPDKKRKGETFNLFIESLKKLGYEVDFRELRACDYGAPTTRKRLFIVARCDGNKIVWPEPTHGNPETLEVSAGLLKPWRTASDIIDWTIECPSIFERKKPLAENTLKRIAKGFQKFVIDNPSPYIVRIGQTGFGGDNLSYSLKRPLTTITSKNEHLLVTPYLVRYDTMTSKNIVCCQSLTRPLTRVDTSNRVGMVTAFIKRDFKSGIGREVDKPLDTVMTVTKSSLVTAFLVKHYGGNYKGSGICLEEPLHTITTIDHHSLVSAFLLKYYGADIGQSIDNPLHTITTKDRFGLVTIKGENYKVVDIGMRMLQPRELYNAQGFPSDYVIDFDVDGKKYSKAEKVKKCGNAVCPPIPAALVKVNLPECCGDAYQEVDSERCVV